VTLAGALPRLIAINLGITHELLQRSFEVTAVSAASTPGYDASGNMTADEGGTTASYDAGAGWWGSTAQPGMRMMG
jgi:hypothetical protein